MWKKFAKYVNDGKMWSKTFTCNWCVWCARSKLSKRFIFFNDIGTNAKNVGNGTGSSQFGGSTANNEEYFKESIKYSSTQLYCKETDLINGTYDFI